MEVYCHHCGKKRTDDAVYCSQCGRQLHADSDPDTVASAEWAAALSETAASLEAEHINGQMITLNNAPRRKGRGSLWAWLTPTALTVVTAASLFGYYVYETTINDKVIKLQVQAKTEALEGKYEAALATLDKAAAARPGFDAVRADAAAVTHVLALKQTIAAGTKQLEEQKLSEAEHTLGHAQDELKGHLEPIYATVKDQLETQNVKLAVLQLGEKLDELVTVDELAAKLNIANGLESEEAAGMREQIIAKIVDVSYAEAEALLKKKNYNGALSVTLKALTFSKDNERLTALEKKIEQAQAQYEQTEQTRLEQAMQKAAAEDLKNQTAAVDVVNIETTLDEFGDLDIEGELKNAATRPIYGVSVDYTVLDAEGNEISTGVAAVTPDYIEPGETMNFISTAYGVYVENTTVVIDHATWYLD